MTQDTNDQISDMILELPDFARGKLHDARRAEIEEALTQSPELQQELEEVKSFQAVFQPSFAHVNFDGYEANEDRLANVIATAQIDPIEKSTAQMHESRSFLAKLGAFFYGGNIWKPAFALACGVLAFQTFGGKSANPSQTYEALSGPEDSMVASPTILAQFVDSATIDDIQMLLKNNGLEIIAGPQGGFFYLTSINVEADLNSIISILAESTLLETVLPIGDDT